MATLTTNPTLKTASTFRAPQGQVGIRDWLKGQGYGDTDITYKNGVVSLKGKAFTSANPLADQRTYDTAENLQKALGAYRTNEYGNQADSTMKTIGEKVNAEPYQFKGYQPFSYNSDTDPTAQAIKAKYQQDAGRASNNAMVSMGSRGIGNSSATTDRVAQIQQQAATDYNATALPQLEQNAFQRYAADRGYDLDLQNANYGAQRNQLSDLNSYATALSNLRQQGLDNAYRDETMTYQQGRDKVADSQWERQFASQNDQWKQQFARQGEQWLKEFNENARQYNQNYALQKLAQDHNMSMDQAQLAISRMNANLNQQQFNWSTDPNNPDNQYKNAQIANSQYDNLYKTWQATGVAPSGLQALGVQPGTAWRDLSPSDAIQQLSKSQFITTSTDPMTGQSQTSVTDPTGLARAILSMPNMTDAQVDQIASYFGVDLSKLGN
ncbi:hypothetical protein [Gorillibacterium timonense]|uniref:hypothetical protein n=1 Tax=Gorillibacterium timonense TaxID=1689269 RepID=UPI00071CFACC|nr:hypothetical protein [Gorillibacterium timonense]